MIETQKDLKALLKLCRSQGVTEISLGTVRVKFGEAPTSIAGDIGDTTQDDEVEFIQQLEVPLTTEELTAFSNGGDIN